MTKKKPMKNVSMRIDSDRDRYKWYEYNTWSMLTNNDADTSNRIEFKLNKLRLCEMKN